MKKRLSSALVLTCFLFAKGLCVSMAAAGMGGTNPTNPQTGLTPDHHNIPEIAMAMKRYANAQAVRKLLEENPGCVLELVPNERGNNSSMNFELRIVRPEPK